MPPPTTPAPAAPAAPAEMDTDTDTSWSVTLPTLQGLFAPSKSSLLLPFSFTGIRTRFFKSLPPFSLLDPILAFAPPTALDYSPGAETSPSPPSSKSLIKALVDLQTFATQLKASGKHAPDHLDALMNAYMCAVHACEGYDGPDGDVKKAIIPCLEGLFLLRSIRPDVKKVDMAILRTVTTTSIDHSHDHLRPIIQRPIQMSLDLKQSLRRGEAGRATSLPLVPVVSQAEARAAIAAIDTFVSGVEGIQSINGVRPVKTKADKEYSVSRPKRVALDARLTAAFLSMTMATVYVKDVRKRARAEFAESEQGEGKSADHDYEDSGVEWETMAEMRLKECLVKAWELIDQRRSELLVERMVNSAFTGELPVGPQEPPKLKKAQRESPPDGGDENEDEDEDEEDAEEDEDENELGYPCPLKSLFELHDRYEELRLAVWMSLPSDLRPKMTTFLRGARGEVGSSWDDMGLSLMLDLTGDVLMAHGLPVEKLDKWTELSKQRSAKKVRRRK